MVWQTNFLLRLPTDPDYLFFVFFSTICSYNFHWFFTPLYKSPVTRLTWVHHPKRMHLFLITAGLIGSCWFFFRLYTHALWISLAVILTFLYSAPKLPLPASGLLRRIAIGKTLYLTFVWTYVTTVLPLLMNHSAWTIREFLFSASRFFLIYAICIVFDYRDREQDRKEGIRSMITIFRDRGIDALFYFSLLTFGIATVFLYTYGFSLLVTTLILIPGIIVLFLYVYAKRSSSDYLYYLLLDGLMMLSALMMFINSRIRN